MKRILAVVLLLLAVFCLAACQTDEDTVAVYALTDKFFSAWKDGDYATMYTCLSRSTKQSFSQEEFAAVYTDTASALGYQQATIIPGEVYAISEAQYQCDFAVSYLTENAGLLDYTMSATATYSSRGWELEWNPSLVLPGLQQGDTIHYSTIRSRRGEIYDCNGTLVAANRYADTVVLNLLTCTDTLEAATRLAEILSLEQNDILTTIATSQKRGEEVALITSYMPAAMSDTVRAALNELEDVYIDDEYFTPIRFYPFGQYASHVIGYVGAITEDELKQEKYTSYTGTEVVGKTGLEASYEELLHGTDGLRLAVYSASGKRRFDLVYTPAVDGKDLVLTIDMTLQAKVEQTTLRYIKKGQTSATVVLNPSTGEILAASSYPTYNNNAMTMGVSTEDWAYYQDEANLSPLLNRITRGLYAPGSTMKPFVASWALEEGVLKTTDVFPYEITSDDYWNPKTMYSNWAYHRIKRHASGSGPLNMTRALAHSDNIYFAWAALKLGGERFYERASDLGFTEAIPFDTAVLAPQISGERDIRDNMGLLADSGYGQGEMLVTPLQMACFFSAFANDGTIMNPYVVSSINIDEDGALVPVSTTSPTVWKSNKIESATLTKINPILELVITEGTGYNARISGVHVAGKTGTAQVNNHEHTWMICFVNDDSADLLVCVMVDTPADTDSYRVNMAHDIMKYYLDSHKEAANEP